MADRDQQWKAWRNIVDYCRDGNYGTINVASDLRRAAVLQADAELRRLSQEPDNARMLALEGQIEMLTVACGARDRLLEEKQENLEEKRHDILRLSRENQELLGLLSEGLAMVSEWVDRDAFAPLFSDCAVVACKWISRVHPYVGHRGN